MLITPRVVQRVVISVLTACNRLTTTCCQLHRRHLTTTAAAAATTTTTTQTSAADYIFRQLFDVKTWTYSFLLADKLSREAVIIDPVYGQVERDINIVKELNLSLIYGINTHVHADHVTGTGSLKRHVPVLKSVIAKNSPARADRFIIDGELIKFGQFELECRSTPGHTNGCMTFVWHDKGMLFTGDTLLIRKCGRTNFLDGDPTKLYNSVHEKIFSLPDHYLIYPGHDYSGQTVSSVAEEKAYNVRFKKPLPQFIKIMNSLDEFPIPQFNVVYEETLAANIVDGMVDL